MSARTQSAAPDAGRAAHAGARTCATRAPGGVAAGDAPARQHPLLLGGVDSQGFAKVTGWRG